MAIRQKIKNAARETMATTRIKVHRVREEKRIALLLAIEFVLVAVLVAAMLVYLNPDVNLPAPYSASLEARVFLFILIAAAVLYIYSLTGSFRSTRHKQWQEDKQQFVKKQA